MGLGGSRIAPDYYDQTFGHNFGKPVPPLGPGDLDKAFYSQRHPNSPPPPPPPVVEPVPEKPAKVKKEKKVKQPKHPQKNRVYYYYEEPETIFVPSQQQQSVAQQQPQVIIQQVPVPVPVPMAPQQTVISRPSMVPMTMVPLGRPSRVGRSTIINQPPVPLKAF